MRWPGDLVRKRHFRCDGQFGKGQSSEVRVFDIAFGGLTVGDMVKGVPKPNRGLRSFCQFDVG